MKFNTEIVKCYISYLRSEGIKSMPSDLHLQIKVQSLSTPLLSWVYFNRKGDLSQLSKLVDFDVKRRKSTLGPCLLNTNTQWVEFTNKEKTYLEAMDIIKKAWPEIYLLIQVVSPIISLTRDSDKFESASIPHLFGEILYCMKSNCPIKWAEIIVHEIAHHYLFVMTSVKKFDDFFNRPFRDIRYSNLRSENRPLIGIYHALMAQSCMITLAYKVFEMNTSRKNKMAADKILHHFYKIFPLDFKTIEECGLLGFDIHIRDFIFEAKEKFDYYFQERCAS